MGVDALSHGPPKVVGIKSGNVRGGGSSQEFHFPLQCSGGQGQGPWPGLLYTKRLFTQQGDYKNFVLLLLSRQLCCSALNYSPSRGHFEEVT